MSNPEPVPLERASRTKRERTRGARLRNRDLDILLALARMRVLSTSQLARLFFHAKGTCQKRLRKLFDAGLVRALVTDLAAENRYALTRLGYDLLTEACTGEPMPPFRPPPRIDRRGLLHLDLLNEVRISLALGAAEHGVRLTRFLPDWDLRASTPTAPIVPDAIVMLEHAKQSWRLVLEVDAGTESANVFGRKVSHYVRAVADGEAVFGIKTPILLVVTPTERRARTLARQAVIACASRAVFAWRGSILPSGGIASGLAYAADLTNAHAASEIVAWSRGLMNPQGVRVK